MEHEEGAVSERMSIARCREVLGSEADGLTDTEVDQIRQHADAMAHVLVDVFVELRRTQE
jgi:hypothetical protein